MWWHHAEDDEDQESRLPSWTMLRRIFPFVRPHLKSFIFAFALGIFGVAMILGQPIVLKRMIDVDFAAKDTSGLFRSAGIYLALLVGGGVASGAATILLGRAGVLAVNRIKRVMFDHFLTLGLPWVEKHPVGTLVSRVESDSQRLVNLCSTLAMKLLSPLCMLTGAVIIIAWSDARLFLLALIFLPLMVLGTWFMFAQMRHRFREERRLYGTLTGQVAELVPATRLLQALGRRDWAAARLSIENTIYVRYSTKLHFIEYGFWSGIGLVEIILTAVGLYLGVGWVEDGSMTTGTLVMFAQYAAMIYWPILELSEQLAEIQRAGGAADRVFGALDRENPVPPPAEPKAIPDGASIEFENVTFGYDLDTPVLKNVSFTIPAGQTIALVGATGSGKSTIINLLLRFRDVNSGSIRLGGTDLREFDPWEYRKHFGLVLQDLYLFPAPILENLRAFRDTVTTEEVRQAAERAGILETLERREGGLDAILAEGGVDLSYGERQLVAFTRALAVDPEFLVLDEATSSVDPGTELQIQRTLDSLTQHRTSLVVAHRLSTVRRADRILVLDQGEIIESGTHDELLRRGGTYAQFVALQSAPDNESGAAS
ncbi:MAG: ABC transporter ATP-binding protein [Planctomycetota bacterium]